MGSVKKEAGEVVLAHTEERLAVRLGLLILHSVPFVLHVHKGPTLQLLQTFAPVLQSIFSLLQNAEGATGGRPCSRGNGH